MADLTGRIQIAHLLRRAGFGGTGAEIDEYLALGFAGAVERLLHPEQIAQPELDARLTGLVLDPATNPGPFPQLQIEWFNRMIATKRPLQEKMALFWHGHFATANSKVNSPFLMRQQYQLFLSQGLGNFRDLVVGVSKDPAMLIWLDGNQNRAKAPNENYGRELLELFLLGIGNYTENDVKAAARAFTGWFFDGQRSTGPGKQFVSGTFAFQDRQHDKNPKTFLGQTIGPPANGDWQSDGLAVIDIALKQPACARFIAGKLFRYFIWEDADPATITPYAESFARDFDLRALVRSILLSPEFSSERAYRARTKDPVEYAAGLLRALGVPNATRDTVASTRQMGLELFNPPNVGGWPSGLGWVSAGSILQRTNYANRVVTARQTNANAVAFDPAKLLAGKNLTTPEQIADYFIGLLLDGNAAPDQRTTLVNYLRLDDKGQPATFTLDAKTLDSKVRGLIHLVASTSAYQLS
jgi:uncharacterized protein (DUF1800 family)